MGPQVLDCTFEKCIDAYTDSFSPSPLCFLNSSHSYNPSSTVRSLKCFANIFIPTTSVIGIICNLTNIFVLSRIQSKTCFHRLLYVLAVFDTGVLLPATLHTVPFTRILCGLQWGRTFLSIIYDPNLFLIHKPNLLDPFNFMLRGGRWLTVAISLERFLGIGYPFKFPAKYRKARHFVIPVLLIALVDTVVKFRFAKNILLHTIPFIVMPIVSIVFLNLKILFTLITMEDIPGSSKEKARDSALVLIAVVVIYLFCWTPTVVQFSFYEFFKSSNQEYYYILSTIGYCAIIINSSINFFIYCLVGKQYRRHLKEAFNCSSRLDQTGSEKNLVKEENSTEGARDNE